MGSRHPTGRNGVRLPELSRRAVLAGTSAAVVPGLSGAVVHASPAAQLPIDTGATPYEKWLYLTAKIERLQTRWAKLESWLVREHGWFQLSPGQQEALPWARELHDIDGCLDLLFEQREAVQATLPAQGATTLEAIIAKLAVVERLVGPDDHGEAYALLAGARQDLIAMARQRPQLRARAEARSSEVHLD